MNVHEPGVCFLRASKDSASLSSGAWCSPSKTLSGHFSLRPVRTKASSRCFLQNYLHALKSAFLAFLYLCALERRCHEHLSQQSPPVYAFRILAPTPTDLLVHESNQRRPRKPHYSVSIKHLWFQFEASNDADRLPKFDHFPLRDESMEAFKWHIFGFRAHSTRSID